MDTNTVIESALVAYIAVALLAPFAMLADLLMSSSPKFGVFHTKDWMIIFSGFFVVWFGSVLTGHIIDNL